MILYVGTKQRSSWSLRPYLALKQGQIAFEHSTIFLDRADTKARIAAVSPTGRVPVLHDGELVIPDSLAICEYAAELAPSLWPTHRADRARARAVACEMHSGFAALRQHMSMDILAEDKAGQGHTPEALADAARVMDIWRQCLSQGGPFLFGEFSIADAMFAPVTTRFTTYGVAMDDVCRAYCARVQALPGFVEWKHDAINEA